MLKTLIQSYRLKTHRILYRGFAMSETEFVSSWGEFSQNLVSHFDSKYNTDELFEDVEELDELVKIVTNKGQVFVINRQVPNREIWYSSPLSGPSHYRYDEATGRWINKADREFYEVFDSDMDKILHSNK